MFRMSLLPFWAVGSGRSIDAIHATGRSLQTANGPVTEGWTARPVRVLYRPGDGAQALDRFSEEPPDLVVLDLMLPVIDGLEVFRRIRAGTRTPIIMLTAKGEETDRIVGLELGADDYVTKPFSPREVVARVRAV